MHSMTARKPHIESIFFQKSPQFRSSSGLVEIWKLIFLVNNLKIFTPVMETTKNVTFKCKMQIWQFFNRYSNFYQPYDLLGDFSNLRGFSLLWIYSPIFIKSIFSLEHIAFEWLFDGTQHHIVCVCICASHNRHYSHHNHRHFNWTFQSNGIAVGYSIRFNCTKNHTSPHRNVALSAMRFLAEVQRIVEKKCCIRNYLHRSIFDVLIFRRVYRTNEAYKINTNKLCVCVHSLRFSFEYIKNQLIQWVFLY